MHCRWLVAVKCTWNSIGHTRCFIHGEFTPLVLNKLMYCLLPYGTRSTLTGWINTLNTEQSVPTTHPTPIQQIHGWFRSWNHRNIRTSQHWVCFLSEQLNQTRSTLAMQTSCYYSIHSSKNKTYDVGVNSRRPPTKWSATLVGIFVQEKFKTNQWQYVLLIHYESDAKLFPFGWSFLKILTRMPWQP